MTVAPRKFRSAAIWSFVMNWGQQGFAGILGLAVAAILGPEAYGTVAIALILVMICYTVAELGLGSALVQRSELDESHLHSSFWCIMAGSAVGFVAAVGLGILWARMFDIAGLAAISLALAPLVLIKGCTVVAMSVLRRELDFKSQAIAANAASAVAGTVGLVCALFGLGVWALVVNQLLLEGLISVMVWRRSSYRPGMVFSARSVADLLPFASGALIENIGVVARNRADVAFMAVFFGPLAVGLYRLADRIMSLVLAILTRPVTGVALPYFSRAQADREALTEAVRHCVRLSAALTIPAMGVIAGLSVPITQLLGTEWREAAGPLATLCLAGAISSVTLFTAPLLLATGRSHVCAGITWLSGLLSISTYATIAVLMQSAPLETQLVGMGLSRVAVVILVFGIVAGIAIQRLVGIRLSDIYRPVLWPSLIGLAAFAGGSWASQHGLPAGASPAAALALQAIALSAAAALATAFIERGVILSAYRDLRAHMRGDKVLGDGAMQKLQEP